MRILFIISLLFLVSCGKSDSKSNSLVGSMDKVSPAEPAFDEIEEAEMLEVSVEVPIELRADSIFFQKTVKENPKGRRIECPLEVVYGDHYNYTVAGNELELFINGYSFTYKRINEGQGLMGRWLYTERSDGVFIKKGLTFVDQNTLVMTVDCETI